VTGSRAASADLGWSGFFLSCCSLSLFSITQGAPKSRHLLQGLRLCARDSEEGEGGEAAGDLLPCTPFLVPLLPGDP